MQQNNTLNSFNLGSQCTRQASEETPLSHSSLLVTIGSALGPVAKYLVAAMVAHLRRSIHLAASQGASPRTGVATLQLDAYQVLIVLHLPLHVLVSLEEPND